MDQPLPAYTREQINRTSKIKIEIDNPPSPIPSSQKKPEKPEIPTFISKEVGNGKDGKQAKPPIKKSVAKEGTAKKKKKSQKSESEEEKLSFKNGKEAKKVKTKTHKAVEEDRREEEELFGELRKKRERLNSDSNKPDNNTPKRIKSNHSLDSKFGLPLINPEFIQKNKITTYFDSKPQKNKQQNKDKLRFSKNSSKISDQEKNKSADELSEEMVRLSESRKEDMVKLEKYEQVLKDKDREIARLHRSLAVKENDQLSYKKTVKKEVSKICLELEYYKKFERKNFIVNQKQRIGEFVSCRAGAKYVKTWIDGVELRRLRSKLSELAAEKEVIDKIKKQIKRKKSKSSNGVNGEDIKAMNDASDFSNSNIIDIVQYRNYISNMATKNDSLVVPPEYNYFFNSGQNISEVKERVNYQLQFLTKEENMIKEQIEQLKKERDKFIAIVNNINEEENSRFGKIDQQDKTKLWPLLSDKYQLLSLLGKGGFSEVYKAYDCENLCFVACKIHQLSPSWSETVKSNYIRHALRENQVLKVLSHPNIIRHYDSVEIDSNSFCTVLEFCSGPDLATYLKHQKTLSEKEAKQIVKQLLSALKFLNENDKKIIHYDLKPQNIMYHKGLIKISDFGLCKIIEEGETRVELTSQGVGTYWYLPPECFNPNYPKISTKVDVWSIGVICFEMLYGYRPFGHNMSQERILKEGYMLNVKEVAFPNKPTVSNELKNFIKNCLEYYQEQRVDIMEAFEIISNL